MGYFRMVIWTAKGGMALGKVGAALVVTTIAAVGAVGGYIAGKKS